jgi:hypothetical protein
VASGVAISLSKITTPSPRCRWSPYSAGRSDRTVNAATPPPFLQQGASGTRPPGQGSKTEGKRQAGETIAQQIGDQQQEAEVGGHGQLAA